MSIKVHVVLRSNGVYHMRYVDPGTGTQVWKTTKENDWDLALKAAGRWEKHLNTGGYAEHGDTAWFLFRRRFENVRLPAVRENTRKRYRTIMDQFEEILAKYTGDEPGKNVTLQMQKITNRHIEDFMVSMRLRKNPLSENTISSVMNHLKCVLSWAYKNGFLERRIEFPTVPRSKAVRGSPMKGRPITEAEFAKILANAPDKKWRFFLKGLWLSGLRLEESLNFWWDRRDKLHLHDGMLRIFGEDEKGRRDRLMPLTPDFVELLESVPKKHRKGRVFQPFEFDTPDVKHISRLISRIGAAAEVVVDERTKKPASAHDFRRSFGERWAMLVEPFVLMQLMRHQDISTTMRYYAGRNAKKVMDLLKKVVEGTQKSSKTGSKSHKRSLIPETIED